MLPLFFTSKRLRLLPIITVLLAIFGLLPGGCMRLQHPAWQVTVAPVEVSPQLAQLLARLSISELQFQLPVNDPVFAFPTSGLKTRGYLCNYSPRIPKTLDISAISKEYLSDYHDWGRQLLLDFFRQPEIQLAQQSTGDSNNSTITLSVRIIAMRGVFCRQHHFSDLLPLDSVSGELSMEIEWNFYIESDERFSTITTASYHLQYLPLEMGIKKIFSRGLLLAARQLITEPNNINTLQTNLAN